MKLWVIESCKPDGTFVPVDGELLQDVVHDIKKNAIARAREYRREDRRVGLDTRIRVVAYVRWPT